MKLQISYADYELITKLWFVSILDYANHFHFAKLALTKFSNLCFRLRPYNSFDYDNLR